MTEEQRTRIRPCLRSFYQVSQPVPADPTYLSYGLERFDSILGGDDALRCRLKDRFLGDLLSKYLAVYARVGAPDFSEATVTSYAQTLEV